MFLACLKKAEFEDSLCQPEFRAYSTCVEKDKVTRSKLREAMKQGLLGVDDSNRLSFRQINRLMAMYPQPQVGIRKIPIAFPGVDYCDPMFDKLRAKH